MRELFANTPYGQVQFLCREECFSGTPIMVMFHGFCRYAEQLAPWHERLPFEVVFARLPNHGAPELDRSLVQWRRAFRSALAAFPVRPSMVVGESLGAMVALAMRLPVVAIEPFIHTAHLWPMEASRRQAMERGEPIDEQALEAFFLGRQHFDVLEEIQAPALIIGGDEPLEPMRLTSRPPSMLDDRDFSIFASHQSAKAIRISGGHVLLKDNPEECFENIMSHAKILAA